MFYVMKKSFLTLLLSSKFANLEHNADIDDYGYNFIQRYFKISDSLWQFTEYRLGGHPIIICDIIDGRPLESFEIIAINAIDQKTEPASEECDCPYCIPNKYQVYQVVENYN